MSCLGQLDGFSLDVKLHSDYQNNYCPMPKHPKPTLPSEIIEQKIYLIRGHKVMLDRDLADLYQVKTIALRQQAKKKRKSFPG